MWKEDKSPIKPFTVILRLANNSKNWLWSGYAFNVEEAVEDAIASYNENHYVALREEHFVGIGKFSGVLKRL